MAKKNQAAVTLVGLRWKKASDADRARQGQVLKSVRSALTPEQRSEIARKAVLARWAKRKGKKETSPEGST